MKKLKNDNGNILLEVLLMIAIMFVVFPIIQKNVKERSDTLRNQLVVKDMMKLKTATENYLKLRPDITEGVHVVSFATLEENGLPKNFKNSNIIGQNYRVKMRSMKTGDGNVEYDAIIIADGNPEISDMRIREIVKESRGFGGYLEDGIIYGTSWSLDGSGWGENWSTPPVIFKVGFPQKDYQYISRNGIGSSTMKTDLFMNLNDIEMVNDFVIAKGMEDLKEGIIEVNNLYLSPNSETEISILSIDEQLNLNAVMDADNATVALPNGINQSSVSIDDNTTSNVYLHSTLKILNNLSTSFSEENVVSFADILKLSVTSSVDMVVGSLIKTPELSTIVAEFGTVDLSSINIDAKYSDTLSMNYKDAAGMMYQSVGFVFDNIYSNFNKSKYNIKTGMSPEVNLSDVIVKRVNQELGIGNRIGNIVITDKTPLSVVLRALSYEYADIFRVVTNNYNGMIEPISGLRYDEYYRCAKQQCFGNDSNDNQYWSY